MQATGSLFLSYFSISSMQQKHLQRQQQPDLQEQLKATGWLLGLVREGD